MLKNNLKLDICHLYPKLLNIYGDRGNIITLKKRCLSRNIDVNIIDFNLSDDINKIKKCDLFFIGGGQDKQQIEVSIDLKRIKEFLREKANNNCVFLGICGGYQLMGEYYKPHNLPKQEGLNLLDIYTIASNKRYIGNVRVKINIDNLKTILVGFENHSGLTYINSGTKYLGKLLSKEALGNNGQDKTEGAYKNNVFGTYLHGSVLPKNPNFADYLIKVALQYKYNENIILTPLDDYFEKKAHDSLLSIKY